MQAIPVEQLETLFFGKPTPLKKLPRLESVWSTASGSSTEGSQPAGGEEEEEGEEDAEHLLMQIQQQLEDAHLVRWVGSCTGVGCGMSGWCCGLILKQETAMTG